MFAIAEIPFEDKRFGMDFGVPGDFSTIKRPEFDAAKAAGELDAGLGKVPILEVDGVKISQSKAIERYVAKLAGMAGSSDVECALIEAQCEHIRDLKDAYQKVRAAPADEKVEAMAKYFGTTLPETLLQIEKALPVATAPFLIGDKLSLADVSYFVCLCEFFDNKEGAKAAYAPCPKIAAAIENFAAHPTVKAYQAGRPETLI